jgi:sulfate transport system permease protein
MRLLKNPSVLPGFNLSLGLTVLCLSLLVVLPFAMMAAKAGEIGWAAFWQTIAEPNVLAAVWLSLRMSFYAMLTNIVFGTLVAWVLVRYEFPGKNLVNALVDLPFALPTAVTGIALATLYAPNGWLGRWFAPFDIKIAFTPIGIWIALVFVSLPFIVRAVQPVLEELPAEYEEAAATLGAGRFTACAPRAAAGNHARSAHRLGHDVCPRHRRIWLGDFYCRQYPDGVGNSAADYHRQARAIRCAGRGGGGACLCC